MTIKVTHEVYSSSFTIDKALKKLSLIELLSFDVETRSIFTEEEIAYAKNCLKDPDSIPKEDLSEIRRVGRSSGLSYPAMVDTTHFIFGTSKEHSIILIAYDERMQKKIWDWVSNYKGKLLIHNAGFDLKICKFNTGKIPVDFEDTQLLAKCYINNADNYKAKVGLKILMGHHYDPKWSLFEDYNVKDFKNSDFISYAAIDGAATYYLWELLQQEKINRTKQ